MPIINDLLFKCSSDPLSMVHFTNTFEKCWGFYQKAVSCYPNDLLLGSPTVKLLVFCLAVHLQCCQGYPAPSSRLNGPQGVLLKVPIKLVQPLTCTFISLLFSHPHSTNYLIQKNTKGSGVIQRKNRACGIFGYHIIAVAMWFPVIAALTKQNKTRLKRCK